VGMAASSSSMRWRPRRAGACISTIPLNQTTAHARASDRAGSVYKAFHSQRMSSRVQAVSAGMYIEQALIGRAESAEVSR
jgi:hypothetical protein